MSSTAPTLTPSGALVRPNSLSLPRLALTGLWSHPEFLKLWAGQTVSLFGSEVTLLALPLTAALVLGASPAQVGLLKAAEQLPYLLIGLFAGVIADRLKRKPILLVADLGRGALLLSVPAAAFLNVLSLQHLYVVAFLTGILTVFFNVAYQAYLPGLVDRSRLSEGNTKLETSRSAAEVAGVSLGGFLIQVATAPVGILIDAVTFLVSGVSLCLIQTKEPAPAPKTTRPAMWREIREGMSVAFGHRLLRPLVTCSAAMNLCYQALFAAFVLYVTEVLRLEPAFLGFILAAGSGAGILGAAIAGRLAERFGIGRAIVGGAVCSGVAGLAIPLADGPQALVVGVLVVSQALLVFGLPIYNVNALTLRQTLVPSAMLGRVTGAVRFANWGVMPVGAALGGLLGEAIGLRPTLFIATVGLLLSSLIVLYSPVRLLKDLPETDLS